jgi:hypothetical protein
VVRMLPRFTNVVLMTILLWAVHDKFKAVTEFSNLALVHDQNFVSILHCCF